MASILKVDELQGIASAGSITVTSEGGSATQSLQQGLAKAWNCFDGTGTISLRDSLNTASLTDNGTANYDTNFTNSFANNDYAFVATNCNQAGANNQIVAGTSATSKTTGEFGIRTQNYAGTFSDVIDNMTAVHGDLA